MNTNMFEKLWQKAIPVIAEKLLSRFRGVLRKKLFVYIPRGGTADRERPPYIDASLFKKIALNHLSGALIKEDGTLNIEFPALLADMEQSRSIGIGLDAGNLDKYSYTISDFVGYTQDDAKLLAEQFTSDFMKDFMQKNNEALSYCKNMVSGSRPLFAVNLGEDESTMYKDFLQSFINDKVRGAYRPSFRQSIVKEVAGKKDVSASRSVSPFAFQEGGELYTVSDGVYFNTLALQFADSLLSGKVEKLNNRYHYSVEAPPIQYKQGFLVFDLSLHNKISIPFDFLGLGPSKVQKLHYDIKNLDVEKAQKLFVYGLMSNIVSTYFSVWQGFRKMQSTDIHEFIKERENLVGITSKSLRWLERNLVPILNGLTEKLTEYFYKRSLTDARFVFKKEKYIVDRSGNAYTPERYKGVLYNIIKSMIFDFYVDTEEVALVWPQFPGAYKDQDTDQPYWANESPIEVVVPLSEILAYSSVPVIVSYIFNYTEDGLIEE